MTVYIDCFSVFDDGKTDTVEPLSYRTVEGLDQLVARTTASLKRHSTSPPTLEVFDLDTVDKNHSSTQSPQYISYQPEVSSLQVSCHNGP